MPMNFFANAFSALPQNQNMSSNGFSMRAKRNPFRGLTFEQPEPEQEEQQSFFGNYPRPRMSAYEQFLQEERQPQFERSKGAKIAAAVLAGIGGYAGNPNALRDTNAALRAPYEREMEQYELEGGRLKELSGLEGSRIKQEQEILDSIRDYELKKADDARQDLLARNTIETGGVTRENLRSQIANRGKSLQRNTITGELELVDQNDFSRKSLGAFDPSYGTKRFDEATEYDRRDKNNFEQQKLLQSRGSGLSYGNALRLRQFDLNNPSANTGIIPPTQQKDAEEMADTELLYGPMAKYASLLKTVPNPTTANPKGTGRVLEPPDNMGVVEKDIWERMYADYQRERAMKINEILTKSRNRFEITPIK